MIVLFLEKNPFYILEVSPNDKRAEIISKAEDKAFFSESENYEEAKTRLLNPEKRISAELDWFFGITDEKAADIYLSIRSHQDISTEGLSGISELNATLHNFSISTYDDFFEVGYAILEIDEQYNNLDSTKLVKLINDCREQAGIHSVTEAEIDRGIQGKRDQIRQLISEKTQNLCDNDYIEFATLIADKCIADEDYNDGVIVSDIVDQYEIKMNPVIEEASDGILSLIEKTKELSDVEEIGENITKLICLAEKWDRYVQPLQLKAMASGVPHEVSESIGGEIRGLYLWLHNEKGFSELSLHLVEAMKSIFAELSDMSDVLESDGDALKDIINRDKEMEPVIAAIESLKASADKIKSYATSLNVDEFISKVKEVDIRIKYVDLNGEQIVKARETVYYIARDVAITLHNNKQLTEYALRIATALLSEFSDIAGLRNKLKIEVLKLEQQLKIQEDNRRRQEAGERGNKFQKVVCFIVLGSFLTFILFLFVFLSITTDSSPSNFDDISASNTSNTSNTSGGYITNDDTFVTITLDNQGGSGGTDKISVRCGNSMPKATAPTRSGYLFAGYYSSPNGGGTKYYDMNMDSMHSWDRENDSTIYAYWVATNGKVELNADSFEDHFALTTDAEYDGNGTVIVTYSISPRSSSYAQKDESSDTVSVEIGVKISYVQYYFGDPDYDTFYNVELSKSNGYTASGTIEVPFTPITDTFYWDAGVVSCTGEIKR